MADKKAGRPRLDDPTDIVLSVRVNRLTKARITELTDQLEVDRSKVIKRGIDELYERQQAGGSQVSTEDL